MATAGDDDEGKGRKNLRVASRAVRRGRTLRPSVLPPAPRAETADSPEDAGDVEAPASDRLTVPFQLRRATNGDEGDGEDDGEDDGEREDERDLERDREDEDEDEDQDQDQDDEDDEDQDDEDQDDEDDEDEDDEDSRVTHHAVVADEPDVETRRVAVSDLAVEETPAPSSAGPSIQVRESTLPEDPPPSTRGSPSIRIHESLLPDDFDDEDLLRSARFSRPPAPALDFGGKRKDRVSVIGVVAAGSVQATPAHADVEAPSFGEETLDSQPLAPDFRAQNRKHLGSVGEAGARHDRVDVLVESASFATPSERGGAPSSRGAGDDVVAAGQPRGVSSARFWIGVGVATVAAFFWFSRTASAPEPMTQLPSAVAARTALPTASATTAPPSSVVPPAFVAASTTASSTAIAPTDDLLESSDYDALRKRFVSMQVAHKLKESEAIAHRLIELRPQDATGYRCLGASLQDQLRLKDAKRAYSDCVTHASKGDVAECAQLGGTLKK